MCFTYLQGVQKCSGGSSLVRGLIDSDESKNGLNRSDTFNIYDKKLYQRCVQYEFRSFLNLFRLEKNSKYSKENK